MSDYFSLRFDSAEDVRAAVVTASGPEPDDEAEAPTFSLSFYSGPHLLELEFDTSETRALFVQRLIEACGAPGLVLGGKS